VAGCVSIREDFDKWFYYACYAENWRHYIGIDFDNTTTVDGIADEPGILERISTEEGDGYLSITLLYLQPYVFLRQLALECMRNCAQRS